MSLDHVLRLLHMLSLFMMVSGLMALLLPLLRGWQSKNTERLLIAFEEADTAKVVLLVPGTIFTGITGFVWALQKEYNFLTTGWLLALTLIYLFTVFLCLPLIDFGLRRVEMLAMQASKTGEGISDELRDAMADNVPLVFGIIILASIPVMAWLPIFKPF